MYQWIIATGSQTGCSLLLSALLSGPASEVIQRILCLCVHVLTQAPACVFLISAPAEPGNFVLIKTSQWFRDEGAHTCTGSAGGWRFLGSVSHQRLHDALSLPGIKAVLATVKAVVLQRKQGFPVKEAPQVIHRLKTQSGHQQKYFHYYFQGDRFLWRPIFSSATAFSLMFWTVTFRCVKQNHRAGGQRFGFRLQKEAIIKKPWKPKTF